MHFRKTRDSHWFLLSYLAFKSTAKEIRVHQTDYSAPSEKIGVDFLGYMNASHTAYCIYLLECCDGTYYCGITTDMAARLKQHNDGTASRYTRGRTPVRVLVRTGNCYAKNAALKIEHAIKQLPRHRKAAAIITAAQVGKRGHPSS